MKNMIKDALVLCVITLTAGLVLGFVYQLTKEPIAAQELKAKQKAYQEVFQDAAGFEAWETLELEKANAIIEQAGYTEEELSDTVQEAQDTDGNVIGYVLTVTTHAGYGGDITLTVGIRTDGTLNGISILKIAETPGLGMKAEDVLKPQFAQKKVQSFEYTKTGAMSDMQIDAISGATITTSAVTNAVNAGLAYFKEQLQEGGAQ